ncbi:MAG: CHASE domain-containing protein [Rubrivivax sp.]|nr:CHASE domain-containing protein [Rubrivivax sp.]
MTPRSDPGLDTAARPAALAVVLITALAYALVGALALVLAGPPGYASPLYPSAGLALAAVLVYGRTALPGVFLGAFAVNAGLGALRGQAGLSSLLTPALIGVGAALQAGVGAALIRRYVGVPLVLNAPRDILRAGVLGALVACSINPSVATLALLAGGVLGRDAWFTTWLTWWLGDALGVLIGAPLVLTVIGRPRSDWQPRRRTVAVPLLLALALLATGMAEFHRLDRHRLTASFERDADRLASEAQARLALPLHALQAIKGAVRGDERIGAATLHQASRWWLAQPIQLQATGCAELVLLEDVPAFEAAARAEGLSGYRVFDRDNDAARAADREVVALRRIEPAEGNVAALGVNVLSIPAARAAVLETRRSGNPAATTGFQLTQLPGDETGIVLYQALYRGEPADQAARIAQFRGVVFVTVRTERALAGLARPEQQYLRWCLVDPDPAAARHRLAGPAGCDTARAPDNAYQAVRRLELGGRAMELRIVAPEGTVPGAQVEASWLLALVGMAAAALLGALLLTVTGHSRRTELAVQKGTSELRREVAERTHAETALRESEARLRAILDHAPIGVMFLDPQGRIIDCNLQLCRMAGHSAQELRGRSVTDLAQPQEAARLGQMRRELIEGAADSFLEDVALRHPQGREQIVRVATAALRDPQGRMARMVAVVQDITEQLRLEASERALHQAEAASRAKSEFVSRMSHELRTPLNAMIGFTQLLGMDREPGLSPQQQEWTQHILRAGWHLLEMINETLDLARIESGAVKLTLVPVDFAPLAAACRSMVAPGAAQRGIRIDEVIAPGLGAVLGDTTRLKQVLTNLLSNAVKYNHEGGVVTLTARRLDDGHIEVAVADTGMGMTPEQLASLFQPYNRLGRESTGIEGSGIGLVISRRLTELMGGTIVVSSEAGVGSIFTLRLPATQATETPAAGFIDSSPAPYQQRLVHYVEDNETNIEVMRGVFAQRAQIRLETSTLGLDGLASIRQRRPDLILLDMHLPDISGLELLRHLKQDDSVADIPVIVVSADATPETMRRALVNGALHYVTKPLDVARFLQIIDGILEAVETRWGL